MTQTVPVFGQDYLPKKRAFLRQTETQIIYLFSTACGGFYHNLGF